MRILAWVGALLLLLPTVTVGFTQGQPPLVVFVEDNAYGVASVTDNGPDGLTKLAAMFQSLGARTTFVRLRDPLPEEAKVIVLVRPRRSLPGNYLAHLWVQVEKGASLLLALDPPGQFGSPDAQNGGLDRLLTWDYGITLLNGLIAEPWSTLTSITSLNGSILSADADPISNPITDPLLRYGVPVVMWGARPLSAELLGVEGSAFPLLDTTGFAETDTRVFSRTNPDPLVANIGRDPQGTLVVGAASENATTTARVAVLGDSEMVENGYGFAGTPALYPGDVILAQRLAGWLLKLPEETWALLPSGFTWIQLDGSGADWSSQAPITPNPQSDTTLLPFSIAQVRAFRNQSDLYLLVETRGTPSNDARLDLHFDTNVDGTPDVNVIVDADRVFIRSGDGAETPIADAAMAVGEGLEVRLPLRVTGIGSRIPGLCLTSRQELLVPVSDCLDQPIAVRAFAEQDPSGLRLLGGLAVSISSTDVSVVNLRSGPSTSASVRTTARVGELFSAIGRNQAGDWILVQNARVQGWIAASLAAANGDLQALPVVEQGA